MPARGGNRLPTQRKVLKMKLEVSGSENEPAFFWASNPNGFIVRLLLRTSSLTGIDAGGGARCADDVRAHRIDAGIELQPC